MTEIRHAHTTDAAAIGAVHVAAWRSAYPGILPDTYLAQLSPQRQAAFYDRAIRTGRGVFVAIAEGMVVGFASIGRPRSALGDGEIETLYVLDDWRDRGLGRRLMAAAAAALQRQGCASAFVWVLRDNPGRWFYAHLGGKEAMGASIRVAGTMVPQIAYVWNPIGQLQGGL